MNDGLEYPHLQNLNFTSGIQVTQTENGLEISADSANESITHLYWDGSNDRTFYDQLLAAYRLRATKPCIVITAYHNNLFMYLIDGSYPDITQDGIIEVLADHTIDSVDTTDISRVKINQDMYNFNIVFKMDGEDYYIESTNINKTSTELTNLLSLNGNEETTAFIPTYGCQPATKEYVDTKTAESQTAEPYVTVLGDGSTTVFTIEHNLNNENVNVILRTQDTREQIYAANKIDDANAVTITFDAAPALESIIVYIYKL